MRALFHWSAACIDSAKVSAYLDAEHVVILVRENRSFDHAYGTLRGFNDPRILTFPNGSPVWFQSNAAGEAYVPFRLARSLSFDLLAQPKAFKQRWMNTNKKVEFRLEMNAIGRITKLCSPA